MEVVNLGGAGWVVKTTDDEGRTVYLAAYGNGYTRSEDNARIFDSREQAERAAR